MPIELYKIETPFTQLYNMTIQLNLHADPQGHPASYAVLLRLVLGHRSSHTWQMQLQSPHLRNLV